MTIYIDELFFINTLTNFLLLFLAGQLSGSEIRMKRLFFSASLGGIYSVCMIFPDLKLFISFVYRLIFSLGLVSLAYGRQCVRQCVAFYLSMLVFSGVIIMFINSGANAVIYNGSLYFSFPMFKFIILTALATFSLNKIGAYLKKALLKQGVTCRTQITINGKTEIFDSIFDTGNFLKYLEKPVAVADINTVKPLFPGNFLEAIIKNDYETAIVSYGAVLVPYTGVGSHGFLIAITPDEVKINGKAADMLLGITTNACGKIIVNPWVSELGVIQK